MIAYTAALALMAQMTQSATYAKAEYVCNYKELIEMTNHSLSSGRPMPRVLVCDPLHNDGIDLLRQHCEVDLINGPKLSVGELEERIGGYQAVINRSRTALPESVIRQGKQLRVIVRAGAGLDNIAVECAEEMGIAVDNCPGANAVAVAEHAFALMLGLSRHIAQADRSMKAGEWEKNLFAGAELQGKTLGIIGFGNIGREVAKRAIAFGMTILVNQNRLTPELASEWRVENVDLLQLLAAADYVTLHVPLRPANIGMIGAKELSYMKPTAYLINTSRGGIVDEQALLEALESGRLHGAGIDVFENEPEIFSALAQHPKVLATPHIGASTADAQRNAGVEAARKVVEALQQRGPADAISLRLVPVNQVFPHEAYHGPRVDRLAQRIDEDGLLANPPLVAELPDNQGYVVLDGATRTTAFKMLKYPHIVVQVVDMSRDVQLHSWFHAIRDVQGYGGVRELLSTLRQIPGITLIEKPLKALNEALLSDGALGYMISSDKRGYLLAVDAEVVASGEADWLNLLDRVVQVYGEWGDVERTLVQEVDHLKAMYNNFSALFVYPAFTPDIVLQIASQGRLLPAGITRFVIPGRILRLNAPLAILKGDMPFALKQEWLDRFVEEKLGARQVRYYQEPVMLLDE